MANDVQYDPSVIQKLANNLYSLASMVVAAATFIGLIFGGAAGYFLGSAVGAAIGALVMGLLSYVVGQQVAFTFRLQAQQALCQLHIEANTRK